MSKFFHSTAGLECWTSAGIKMLRVQGERQSSGSMRLSVISGRNGAQIKAYGTKTLSPAVWEDRPTDPYDCTVEAIWALGLFDLEPAALHQNDDD